MDLPSQAANAYVLFHALGKIRNFLLTLYSLLQLRIALCSPVYYVSFDIGSCLGSVVLFPPT